MDPRKPYITAVIHEGWAFVAPSLTLMDPRLPIAGTIFEGSSLPCAGSCEQGRPSGRRRAQRRQPELGDALAALRPFSGAPHRLHDVAPALRARLPPEGKVQSTDHAARSGRRA